MSIELGIKYELIADPDDAAFVNLVTNPSFEVDAAGWTANGSTIARSTAVAASSGSAVLAITATGTAAANAYHDVTVTPGLIYSAGADFRTASVSRTARVTGQWLDAANAQVGSVVEGNNVTTNTTSWQRSTMPATVAPAGAVKLRLLCRGATVATAGEVYYLDAVQAEQASVASSYFDGSFDYAKWSGTAHASAAMRGSRAVFNDSADANFVGFLTDVAGLDSAEVRISGEDNVEGDGGTNGPAYFGRRPVSLEGILPQSTLAIRASRIERLQRIGRRAMRADCWLVWTEQDGIARQVKLRRAGRWAITGGVDKRFICPMIAASHLIESAATLKTTGSSLTQTVTNSGNAEALPILEVFTTPAITSPLTIKIDGVTVAVLNYAVPASSRAIFDFAAKTVVRGDGLNLYQYLDFALTTWKGIPPGAHTITADKGVNLVVTHRHSWA